MRKLLTLLLLALAGLALFAEALAWAKSGFSRQWLTDRLSREDFLFSPAGAKKRQALGQPVWLAALALLLADRIFWQSSQLYSRTPPALMTLFNLFYLTIFTLLAIKFFLLTRLSLIQFFSALGVFAVVVLALSANYEYGFFAAMGFVLTAKDVAPRVALRTGLWGTLLSIGGLALLTFAGILGNYSTYTRTSGQPRLIFGFQHPSLLGMYLLSAVVALFLLRFPKLHWPEWLCAAGAFFVAARLADSRSATVALLVFFAAILSARFLPRLFALRPVRALLTVSPMVCAATCVGAGLSYSDSSEAWNSIDAFSSGRIRLCWLTLTRFTPGLRGQRVISGQMGDPSAVYTLDNSYLYLLYYGGVLLFLLFLAALCLLMYRTLAARRYELSAALLCWLAFGMLEQYLFYPWANLLLIYLAGLVYRQPLPERAAPLPASVA